MKCHQFQSEVLLLIRKSLADSLPVACLEHAQSCVQCARRLAEEKALLTGIEAVVGSIVNEKAPARVEAVLLEAFRNHSAVVVPVVKRNVFLHRSLAIAASLLLVSLAGWLFVHRNSAVRKERLLPASSAATRVDVTENRQPAPKPQQRKHARSSHQPRTSQHEEQLTRFFPLHEGIDLDSPEIAQLVRLELPSSELREFGLPIAADARSVSVTADILLGFDGQALAIRFVNLAGKK